MTTTSTHRMAPDAWFITASGRRFWPIEPDAEDINILDIAFALSNICRFGGHVEFYSVAQHSCLVHDFCPPELKLCGLLHDASEAYAGDVIRPLKQMLPDYVSFEKNLGRIIFEKFGLPWPMPKEVKLLDDRALLTERNALMPESEFTRNWKWDQDGIEPFKVPLFPWSVEKSREEFLTRFVELTDK